MELFTKETRYKNNYIYYIKLKDISKVKLVLPIIQRLEDSDKIKEIVSYQISYYERNNTFNFPGVIIINYCKKDSTYYLIDGQHRYKAMLELAKKGYDNDVVLFQVKEVDTMKEYEENYCIINKNTPLPELKTDKNISERVLIHYTNKYKNIWKNTKRPNRPHLNKNYFQEAVDYIAVCLDCDAYNIIDLIDNLNDTLKTWSIEQFSSYKSGCTEDMLRKCKKIGLYIGMLPHVSEECSYEWGRVIVEKEKGIKNNRKHGRKIIDKNIKKRIWDHYIGEENGIGKCFCCYDTKISQLDFEASHVLSASYLLKQGKEDDVSIGNLRPFCRKCNNGMRSTNAVVYIKIHFPHNLERFKNDYRDFEC